MVFLDKNSQKITLNRHFQEICDKVTLTNRFTREVFTLSDLNDSSDSEYFYVFEDVDLSALVDGEYTIALYNSEDELIEEMLGVCGDYKRNVTEYQKQNNTRIVYER